MVVSGGRLKYRKEVNQQGTKQLRFSFEPISRVRYKIYVKTLYRCCCCANMCPTKQSQTDNFCLYIEWYTVVFAR